MLRLTEILEPARELFAERWDDVEGALVRGLAAFVRAQLDAFPGNLFWDFDYLFAAAAQAIAEVGRDRRETHLLAYFDQLSGLHASYGRHSAIRFRYVHDFTYGFDWHKWVRRDPLQRREVSPFAEVFLRHLQRRAIDLVVEIAQGNRKTTELTRDGYRNPFGFSREPAEEAELLRELSHRNLIPVHAWEMQLPAFVDVDYSGQRAACAQELELTDGRRP